MAATRKLQGKKKVFLACLHSEICRTVPRLQVYNANYTFFLTFAFADDHRDAASMIAQFAYTRAFNARDRARDPASVYRHPPTSLETTLYLQCERLRFLASSHLILSNRNYSRLGTFSCKTRWICDTSS